MGEPQPRAVLTPVIRVLWMDSTAVPRFEAVPLHNRVTLRTATGKNNSVLQAQKPRPMIRVVIHVVVRFLLRVRTPVVIRMTASTPTAV